jgi:hypothetical protein
MSMSKNDNSFNSSNMVPYSGLGKSDSNYTSLPIHNSSGDVSTKKKQKSKSIKKPRSTAKKSQSKKNNSITGGESIAEVSNTSYMSFVNDTTILGMNKSIQSKVLN